jgi:hypothetical protein
MVLAQTQIRRLLEQNRRPRYESTQLLTKVPKTYDGEKRQALQKMLLGKLDI